MSGKIAGRRKIFAEKVAEGHSATEAYLLAGYRAAKRETAHRAASRLYANPGIRTYIRELRRTGDELAREETTLTIAKKLAFLARIVLTSSATLREDDPLIQSHRILKDGTTSIRIPCKLKALKMHSELAGHFLPEPTEQPPPTDPLQELFDQIRSGKFNDPTPQPTPPPKDEHPLTKLAGGTKDDFQYRQSRDCGSRHAAPSGSHISRDVQPPPASTPSIAGGTNNGLQNHQSRDTGTNQPDVSHPSSSSESTHASNPLHTTTFSTQTTIPQTDPSNAPSPSELPRLNWPSAPTTALHNANPFPIHEESPRSLIILR